MTLSLILHEKYSFCSIAKLTAFQRQNQRLIRIHLGMQGYLILGHGFCLSNPHAGVCVCV